MVGRLGQRTIWGSGLPGHTGLLTGTSSRLPRGCIGYSASPPHASICSSNFLKPRLLPASL